MYTWYNYRSLSRVAHTALENDCQAPVVHSSKHPYLAFVACLLLVSSDSPSYYLHSVTQVDTTAHLGDCFPHCKGVKMTCSYSQFIHQENHITWQLYFPPAGRNTASVLAKLMSGDQGEILFYQGSVNRTIFKCYDILQLQVLWLCSFCINLALIR